MRKIKLIGVCIIAIMLLSALYANVFATTRSIIIEDEFLAQNIASSLNSKVENSTTIDENEISTTDEAIEKLIDITYMCDYQSGNDKRVKSLKGIENFPNLLNLRITFCLNDTLENISELNKLEYINLLGDEISDISSVEKEMPSVKTLVLTTNNIKNLKGIEYFPNLEQLEIANGYKTSSNNINKITDVSGLSKLTKLKNLDLSNYNSELGTAGTYEGNAISDISALEGMTFTNFAIKSQLITRKVYFSDNETEKTIKLPQLFRAVTERNSLVYTENGLTPNNATLSEDSQNVTIKKSDVQNGIVTVKINGGNADGSIVKFAIDSEPLKVVNVVKTPETKDAEKVTVTITANKELDPEKVPEGWTLSNDKKSIYKDFDKNESEEVNLTDIDGNIVTQKVEVSNIKENNSVLEALEISQTEEEQGNGKTKVILTANKELDSNKIPEGWTLLEDGKSIWKIMNQGAEETITLVDKDGNKVRYTVKTKKYANDEDNSKAPTNIPQTGVRNIIIGIGAIIAFVGIVVFIKQRNMLN